MRKLILLLTAYCLLLTVSPAWALVTISGSAAYDGTGIGDGTATNTIATGNVNSLHDLAIAVVCIATNTTDDTTATVSDSAGSTWTRITTAAAGGVVRAELWRANDLLGADVGITVSLTQSRVATVVTLFYAGVAAIGINGTNTGTGTTTPTINLLTQDNNNWVIAGICTNGANPFSASVGTIEAQVGANDALATSPTSAGAIVDSSNATPATLTSTVTATGAIDWAAIAVELRSTTGGTPIAARRKAVIFQ